MKKIITILLISVSAYAGISFNTAKLLINGKKFTAEIADTNERREHGLMYRKFLPENRAMIFIHDDEDYYSYWMKNCFISLDMVFLNSRKEVVHIFYDVPPCREIFCSTYRTPVKAKYIIEFNSGTAKRLGIRKGTVARF